MVLPEYLPQQAGGLITFYRCLLPELVRQGHGVTVLVGSGVSTGEVDTTIDGVGVRFLSKGALRARLPQYDRYAAIPELQRHLAAARALWELAGGGEGFDVIETTDWGLLFMPWVAAGDRPPVVVQLHGSIGQIDAHDPLRGQELQGAVSRLLEGAGLAAADERQTYSTTNAAYWEAATGASVQVIRPAWAARAPAGSEPRTAPGLVAARIQRWKGTETLCRALRALGARAPLIEWVGRDTLDGETGRSYTETLAQRYPEVWGRSLVPLGQRSFAEVAAMQRRAAFVVVPSLWDVFNFTVVEAMAAGAVVIASRGAGAAELIEDGVSGFVVPPGDETALARAIEEAAALPDPRRLAIGAAAQETVRRELDPARMTALRVQRYEALRTSTGRRAPPGWLADAASPGRPLEDPLAFLHHQPLRGLLRHAARRLSGKVGWA